MPTPKPSSGPWATLLRVAWLAILLGLLLQLAVLLLAAGFGTTISPRPFLAETFKTVSWSLLVCVGVALGRVAAKGRLPLEGVTGLLAAPLALTAANAVQKGVAEAVNAAGVPTGPAPVWVLAIKAAEYGCLGLALEWVGRRAWGSALGHLAVGLATGVVFGGLFLAVVVQSASTPLSTPSLLARGLNELLFPVGCALVVFIAEVLRTHLDPAAAVDRPMTASLAAAAGEPTPDPVPAGINSSPVKFAVGPLCELDRGHWACLSHRRTFHSRRSLDRHIHLGEHRLVVLGPRPRTTQPRTRRPPWRRPTGTSTPAQAGGEGQPAGPSPVGMIDDRPGPRSIMSSGTRVNQMPTNPIYHLGAMSEVRCRRRAAAAAALAALLTLGSVLVGCEAQPSTIVVEDFESGAITGWQAVGGGSGGWFVYADGHKAPDPAQSDPNAPFDVPDPPQGRFAAVTDMNGPGTRILYRDLRLEGRFSLQLSVFYAGAGPLSSPKTLAHDVPGANEQFRIDLVRPSAPIDSVAKGDVLVNVFRTSPADPARRPPTEVRADVSAWAGQTVRLRLATTDNQGPLRVGVDNIRFERLGTYAHGQVKLLATPRPSRAIDLVLHRMTQAQAVAALTAHAAERARADEFAGAVLVARHNKVLLNDAWGRADRKASVANTPATRFRIGSMNKMFTAVATLQLAEAHKLALDDPIGKYLPGYPNKQVAAKVTVRHLLTHTGGTGDIFGPEFEAHRLQLREHRDYLKLYGWRGLTQEPGARFEYSNYGFVLLGALIEHVSGESYYDYVDQHVFRPARMQSTGSLPEAVDVPDRAVGYLRPSPTGAWEPNTDTLPWRGTAAGGGYSTVGDLLRFAQALDSGRLISKATLAEATRPNQQQYGYGFDVQGQGRLGSYGHGGGAPGMNGELRVFPELGYVVVSLSNLDPPAASELVEFFTLRMPDH
jgi:D-alanyl-D-alanine carboxypeptidase